MIAPRRHRIMHRRRVALALNCIATSLFVAFGAVASVAVEVEVALLDGRALQGELSQWRNDQLEIAAEDGVATIRADEVLRVRFAPAEDAPPEKTVELIDGSIIPVEAYTVEEGRATLKLAAADEPVIVATALISAVHLQPPTPTIAAQWTELREIAEAGDLIVIRREGAVDHLAGRLGDVSETHVTFYLDDEEFPVERARVDGLVYFHSRQRVHPDAQCVVHGPGGLQLNLARSTLEEDALRARTTGGVQLAVPISLIESVDFSAGRLVYLSELTPRSEKTTPLVAFPASATLAARLAEPIVDRGFFGGEAQLRYPQDDGRRVTTWQLKPHARSIGLRSKSELEYTLPAGVQRFRAVAGIDGTLGGRGNVYLTIHGDGRLLFEQSIDGGDPPREIDLDVADVRRLRILVDYGEGGDAADRLYLCEARVTK